VRVVAVGGRAGGGGGGGGAARACGHLATAVLIARWMGPLKSGVEQIWWARVARVARAARMACAQARVMPASSVGLTLVGSP